MHHPLAHSLVLSLLPCLIPPYAIRLTRVFGTKRVGWALFAVFSLLAMLQVLRSWQPLGLGLDPALTVDMLNFLVPVLLLISMVHIETLFKERVRREQEEERLRADLERQVRDRTAELDQANEELQHEINLRKQGEQELRKSKDQYQFLFDKNPQPMWIFDRQTFKFLAFNSAALRHYGYSKAEFSAMSAKDLCAPEELEAFVADAGKTGGEVQRRGIWHLCRKDGTQVEVEITAQDLVYSACQARLVLANDVSAQRLVHRQWLQAQKAEVTTQLAGGVADNFSRLITTIEEDANALVEKCEAPAQAEPLKRIAATAANAEALTRQLLALVRRHPMRPQMLDLNKVVEAQAAILPRQLGNQIKFEKSCWMNLPPITADPALVEQIIRVLVANARDAMPEGGVLTLSTAAVRVEEFHARQHEGVKPGAHVCLTVSDTGCGMSPEVQERLFEPFFTTKTAGKGTGLGLATVQGLMRQHFGWVDVSSEPGAGSQFAVFFPCAATPALVPVK